MLHRFLQVLKLSTRLKQLDTQELYEKTGCPGIKTSRAASVVRIDIVLMMSSNFRK